MPCTIKLNDRFTVTVTGNSPKELIQGASFWLNDFPCQCGNCKSKNILPRHRKAKGFDFFEVRCSDCKHTVKISEAKEDHSFFIRWDAKWEAPQSGGEQSHQPTSSAPEVDDSDIAY